MGEAAENIITVIKAKSTADEQATDSAAANERYDENDTCQRLDGHRTPSESRDTKRPPSPVPSGGGLCARVAWGQPSAPILAAAGLMASKQKKAALLRERTARPSSAGSSVCWGAISGAAPALRSSESARACKHSQKLRLPIVTTECRAQFEAHRLPRPLSESRWKVCS
jgi:hypothetical protein